MAMRGGLETAWGSQRRRMEKHGDGFRRNRTQEVAGSSPASSCAVVRVGLRPAHLGRAAGWAGQLGSELDGSVKEARAYSFLLGRADLDDFELAPAVLVE